MIVIVQKLYGALELVNLTLHHLLGTRCQVLKGELDPSALHDLLPLVDRLLFPLLGDLPELIREDVHPLVQLLLGLLVLAHVWILI